MDSYSHYISLMPWLAVPYEDSATRTELTTLYGIQGIPSLVLLNPDGSVITEDGRGEINDDPQGMVCTTKYYTVLTGTGKKKF